MSYEEAVHRHLGRAPQIAESVFIAPGASVLGDVALGPESSVWFQAVLRGDINRIVVGAHSNIQDGAVLHVESVGDGTILGDWVTVGHRAIIHACVVADEVLVGMGAIILDGAEIGARSIIGAGAVVTGRFRIPPGSLVLGMPARVIRELSEPEQASIKAWAEHYVVLARAYRASPPQSVSPR